MNSDAVRKAEKELARAQAALERAIEHEQVTARIATVEPCSTGRVVRFGNRFDRDGKVYTYVAIRADHHRGDRRWFVSGNDALHNSSRGHQGLVSPCTWVELVQFAIPHTIEVAPLRSHWKSISNLPVVRNVPPGNSHLPLDY